MHNLGGRIRKIRKQQGRTMEEIGAVVGLTRSMLSKIETGKAVPSVATLSRIAAALGVSAAGLLENSDGVSTVIATRREACDAMVKTEKGYSFFSFAARKHDKLMQPYLFEAKKGETKRMPLSHSGEEFVFVIDGSMQYQVGSVVYTLCAGDTLYFDAEDEHELVPTTDAVTFLAVFVERPRSSAHKQKGQRGSQ